MRNKAFLPLMEQLIMVVIFSLTAVLSLQGFAMADQMSQQIQARNQAALIVQNAAEFIKQAGGNDALLASRLGGSRTDNIRTIFYDNDWQSVSPDEAVYQLQIISLTAQNPLLGSARVQVVFNDTILFGVTVAWQEAMTDDE